MSMWVTQRAVHNTTYLLSEDREKLVIKYAKSRLLRGSATKPLSLQLNDNKVERFWEYGLCEHVRIYVVSNYNTNLVHMF
jgi:hypothetical protein